jgi:tRNA threonylcarbamoyladenosine biosynthesis protein TsaB
VTAGPNLLALETSGPVASVAVSLQGQVKARTFLAERGGHAAGLLPAVDRVLRGAELDRGGIGGIVVGAGPGSFTGVRVAAAAGKGLSHALGVPLWGISSLLAAALTEATLPQGEGPWTPAPDSVGLHLHTRYVLFDARGDRLFTASYRLTGAMPEVLRPPRFARLPEVLADRELAGAGFCGDGAVRHTKALEDDGRLVLPAPLGFPTADGLLRVLALSPELPPLEDPYGWEPDYLRESSARRSGGE